MIRMRLPADFWPHDVKRAEWINAGAGIEIHRGTCDGCGATIELLWHPIRGYTKPIPPECLTVVK